MAIACIFAYEKLIIWDCLCEKGPDAYIIKFPVYALRLVKDSELYNFMPDSHCVCVEYMSDFRI